MAGEVIVTDTLMAAETWSVDLNPSLVVKDRLYDAATDRPRKLHALLFDSADDTLAAPPLLLTEVALDEKGFRIGGVGPIWHLGSDGIGPTEVEKEYLSNANKLSNPLDPANPLDPPDGHWDTGDSIWVIGAGYATTSSATDNETDQLLVADELFRAVPGAQYHTTATIGRVPGYTLGRLRLRHVYTGGPFAHADQLPPFSTWGASVGTSLGQHDVVYAAGEFRCGPSAMPNLIPDGEFAVGPLGPDWGVIGAWGQGTDGGWNGPTYAFTDNSGFDLLVSTHPLSVVQGEQYEMRYVVRVNPGSPATEGDLYMQVAIATAGGPPYTRIDSDHFTGPAPTTDWNIVRTFFEIPEAHISMTPLFVVNSANPGGRFDIDTATLIRTAGNLDFVTSPIFAITPGRSYRWTQPVITDAGFQSGLVSFAIVCFVATRPEVIIQGPSVRVTGGSAEVIEWEFTPPSGMDVCMARIVCQDVVGGSVHLPEAGASIRQADESTTVYEAIGPLTAPANVPLTLSAPAPAGAKDIHLEVVAEANGIGWVMSGFDLTRVAVPATGDDILADILTQPETGDPLSVVAGTISCPEPIPHDWQVLNLTRRDELDHYANVVSDPPREWKITATDPPALDVGTAAVVFDEHPRADAFLISDLDVENVARPVVDSANRPTEVKVIGADRATVSGRPYRIEAVAPVPGPVERDYNNRPIVRTKIVSRGTVEHYGYARALAADLAEAEAQPPLAVQVKLSGKDGRAYPPGDWCHLYHPDANIEDRTLPPVAIAGRTTWPRKVRVLARERSFGPSYYILMREPDGTTWPLPGVLWSDEDAAVLTVGDRRPDWQSDPQGRAEGEQYLNDRKSSPR